VSLIKVRHVILVVILALSAYALWPPADPTRAARLGSAPTDASTLSPQVKYVIKFNPGPLYLPGIVPENSTKPIEGIAKVGRAFEKLYPDTKIEFVGVPGDVREWLVTQLSSGQAPDVIQINVEDVWQDIQKDWYVPLDSYLERPNPFIAGGAPGSKQWWDVFKYPVPTRGTMAPDGRMYCIVLDMIETAIYYNKTLFDRLQLREPRDWDEFLRHQQTIKDAGVTPMLVDRTCIADWGVDLMFEQVYGELRDLLDLDYDPRRGEYLHGYLDWDELIFLHDQGFFTPRDPRWQEVWRLLKEWRPYLSKELNPYGQDMIRNFIRQDGAMYWSSSMQVKRLISDPNLGFEWGLFYLPPIPTSHSRFARGKEMCVIGGSAMQYTVTNAAVADTDPKLPFAQRIERSERLKRVIAFLQFLTTPASCDAVVNEQIALLPNVKGVEPHNELKEFDDILQRHYSMTKWFYTFDNQWNQVLMRMLELYLNDGIDREHFTRIIEQDLERATQRISDRKSLDIERFQQVWDSRAQMRKQYKELPTTQPAQP
jgi:raffinose/stachyose/melibiose transport system substrate-binding protein